MSGPEPSPHADRSTAWSLPSVAAPAFQVICAMCRLAPPANTSKSCGRSDPVGMGRLTYTTDDGGARLRSIRSSLCHWYMTQNAGILSTFAGV